jgi:hypothetical protein
VPPQLLAMPLRFCQRRQNDSQKSEENHGKNPQYYKLIHDHLPP